MLFIARGVRKSNADQIYLNLRVLRTRKPFQGEKINVFFTGLGRSVSRKSLPSGSQLEYRIISKVKRVACNVSAYMS